MAGVWVLPAKDTGERARLRLLLWPTCECAAASGSPWRWPRFRTTERACHHAVGEAHRARPTGAEAWVRFLSNSVFSSLRLFHGHTPSWLPRLCGEAASRPRCRLLFTVATGWPEHRTLTSSGSISSWYLSTTATRIGSGSPRKQLRSSRACSAAAAARRIPVVRLIVRPLFRSRLRAN